MINKASIFLLTVVLARTLPVESMGALSVFQVFFLFSWTALGLGAGTQVARIISQTTYEERGAQLLAVLTAIFVLHIVFFVLVLLFSATGALQITWTYTILPLLSLAQCAYQFALAWLRQTQRLREYMWLEIPCVLLSVAGTVVLVVIFDFGWEARIAAMTIALLLFAVLALTRLLSAFDIRTGFARRQLVGAFSLGRRLVIYLLLAASVSYLDRLLLSHLEGEASAGTYSVYFQISLLVLVVLDSFLKGWTPWLYRSLNHDHLNASEIISTYAVFSGAGFFLSVIAAAVCFAAIPFVFPEAYVIERIAVVPMIFAQWLYCVHHSLSIFLLDAGKPEILTRLLLLVSLLQFLLNLMLIPAFGVHGVALVFLLSCMLMAAGTGLSAIRFTTAGALVYTEAVRHLRTLRRSRPV